jgi:hypothetical protein
MNEKPITLRQVVEVVQAAGQAFAQMALSLRGAIIAWAEAHPVEIEKLVALAAAWRDLEEKMRTTRPFPLPLPSIDMAHLLPLPRYYPHQAAPPELPAKPIGFRH